jgi:hypothetical protein
LVKRLSPSSSSTRLIVVSSSSKSMVRLCIRTSFVSLRTQTSSSQPTSAMIWARVNRSTLATVPSPSVLPFSAGPLL